MYKSVELEYMLDNKRNEVLYITETQHKYNKIHFTDKIGSLTKLRDITDKKGGGLMILYRKDSDIYIKQNPLENNDILEAHVTIQKHTSILLLVYWDVREVARNRKIIIVLN